MQQLSTEVETTFPVKIRWQEVGLRAENLSQSSQQATMICERSYNNARAILRGEWRVVQELLVLEWKISP